MKTRYLISGLALLTMVVGCSNTPSSFLKTDSIVAEIIVTGKDNGNSDITIKLSTPDGRSIDHSPSDSFTALVDGHIKNIDTCKGIFCGGTSYKGEIDTNASNTEILVMFDRGNSQSALGSKVSLPEAFDIVAPFSNQEFDQEDTITISWTPESTTDRMFLDYVVDCKTNEGHSSSNTGHRDINGNGIVKITAREMLGKIRIKADEDCSAKIELVRQRFGRLDVNLNKKKGMILAEQRRVRDIKILP